MPEKSTYSIAVRGESGKTYPPFVADLSRETASDVLADLTGYRSEFLGGKYLRKLKQGEHVRLGQTVAGEPDSMSFVVTREG